MWKCLRRSEQYHCPDYLIPITPSFRKQRNINVSAFILLPNGNRSGETPEPIPNSEAKPAHDMFILAFGRESILLFGILRFSF